MQFFEGQRVRQNGASICVPPGDQVVRRDDHGLFVMCEDGHHYLDPDGNLAGFEPAPDRYPEARALVIETRKSSTSFIQRKLGIGYNLAAELMERLEKEGVVSAPDQTGKRTVLTAA